MELDQKDRQEYSFYLNELPGNWKLVSLESISHAVTDGTHKTPKYQAEGVRFISIRNIRPYQPINWDAYEKYISLEEHQFLIKRCYPEFEDILFPRIGTLGFAKRIDFKKEVSIFVGLGLVKPIKSCILPKFLEFYLNTPYISQLSKEKANGTGRMTLPLEESRKFPVVLPPFDEQIRIVAKVEELFSELDKGIESLKTAQIQLKVYRQAALKHAFEGKLTADWREQNQDKLKSLELFLGHIKLEQEALKDKKTKKIRENVFENLNELRSSEALFSLPEGWHWIPLSWILSLQKKPMTTGPFGTMLNKSEHQESGVPVLGIENIGKGNFLPGNKIFVTNEKAKDLAAFKVEAGDIIISRSGTVGEICEIPEALDTALISTNLLRVSLNQNIIRSKFFVLLFQGAVDVKKQVKEQCKGSSRDFLNQSILLSLLLPIPSLNEQIVIEKELALKFSIITHLELEIEQQLKKAEALRQAILKKAFSGQLVPQDPNDEPASVLLDRICAEKAFQTSTSKKKSATKSIAKKSKKEVVLV